MTTDYDAPRGGQIPESTDDVLDELTGPRSATVDVDEVDSAEPFEPWRVDLSDEESLAWVIPKQADEFLCSSCSLIYHRSRLAGVANDRMVCADCAS